MSVSHHPAEDSLLAYATGKLSPGAALIVGAHADACPHCAEEIAFLERIGGAVLETTETDDVAPGALDRALAALDEAAPPVAAAPPGMPQVLAGRRIGRWRWAGPGVRVAWLNEEAGVGEQLYLLKAQAGARFPAHGHNGAEWVVVLQGAFHDGGDRFGPGDLSERGPEDHHQPVIDPSAGCLCLIATEGRLRLSGVARLMQPIFGI